MYNIYLFIEILNKGKKIWNLSKKEILEQI